MTGSTACSVQTLTDCFTTLFSIFMKAKIFSMAVIAGALFFTSCFKDKLEIGGEQSTMGEVGTTYDSSSSPINGVGDVQGTIVALNNGVSNMTLTATVTNQAVKNVLSNVPGFTVNGNAVTATGIKFKNTKSGISIESPLPEGIIVDYGAKIGDTYPMKGSNRKREVVNRSTTDDYSYGFYEIKVIEIEEPTQSFGIKSTKYWINHKFGLVGILFTLDDGSTFRFPIYCSADNF